MGSLRRSLFVLASLVGIACGGTTGSGDQQDGSYTLADAPGDVSDAGAHLADAAASFDAPAELDAPAEADAPAVPDAASPDALPPDAPSPDAALPDASSPDAVPPDAGAPDAAPPPPSFTLLVTESPPGPDNGNMANWQGVLLYSVAGAGADLAAGTGLDSTAVADPAGLVFRAASSEVFVGNRHGNNSADGVAGSIDRFVWDSEAATLTPNGEITGNSLSGVHQLAINPLDGELFAANFGGGISRFTFDPSGNAVANGVLGSGTIRGIVVSPDGERLYATAATSVIRQFDLGTGAELASFTVSAGSAGLHYLAIRDGELYAAALLENEVYRLTIDPSNDLTVKDSFTANMPISIAFSPDGLEMFVPGHLSTEVIDRYAYDPAGDTWTATTTFVSPSSLGGAITLE